MHLWSTVWMNLEGEMPTVMLTMHCYCNGYGDVDENGGDGRDCVGAGDADDGDDGGVRCNAGAGSPIRSSRSLLGKPAGERLPWKTFSFSSELDPNWTLVSNCFANLSYVSQL